jgi:hypothetical protein
VVPDDKAVGRKLADDAMYKLEHEKDDKGKSQDARPRIEHISYIQDRVKDDYLANRMLRYRILNQYLYKIQCCGSGMFIPDPNFFHPGSASKNLSILINPEIFF